VPPEHRQLVLGLVAVQLGDAMFNAIAKQWVTDDLEHLGFPTELRIVFPAIKSASAAGLLAGLRWPPLGRVTASGLVAYFVVAMGFHARARDRPLRYMPAAAMLAWSILALRAFPSSADQRVTG
jgi:DoxX-like protein